MFNGKINARTYIAAREKLPLSGTVIYIDIIIDNASYRKTFEKDVKLMGGEVFKF